MVENHGSSNPQVFLDELDADSAGSIVVTLCMMWDVKAKNGYQLNTDFVVSDLKVTNKHVVCYLFYSYMIFMQYYCRAM